MLRDESSLTLHIANGLHAGAGCVLPNRPFTIGADFPADVVLQDEGIVPVHLILEPDGGDLKIIVCTPGVVIEGTTLEQGETVVSALPVSIMLGSVELRCEGSVANVIQFTNLDNKIVIRSATALLPKTTLGRAAGAGLLSMLVIGAIALRVLAGNGAPAHAASQVLFHREDRIVGIPGPVELQQMTNQELAVLGLKNVSLSVDSGIVTATGHADPSDAPKIHALGVWFDCRFGDAAVLLLQVALTRSEPLTVQLQAVWDGPGPNIVVGGQRYAEGSTLPDGSIVQKITDRTVLFLQHGQPYSLEY